MIEKVLDSHYEFKGKIFNTRVDSVELSDGSKSRREIIEHSGGVGVIALTDDGEIALVKQYRHPYGEIIYEIPAGKLEKGEDPLFGGKRELSEEAGLSAAEWHDLGKIYPTPGYCGEIIHLYLATGLTKGEAHPDEGEFIKCEFVSLESALSMVMKGEIKDSKTQIAVLKTVLMKGDKA